MKKLFTTLAVVCSGLHGLQAQSDTPCSSGIPGAPTLTVGTTCTYVAGTTVGAFQQTTVANAYVPTCGVLGPDVWYRFIAPAGGTVSILTQAGTIVDGVMALYSGTCGAFTQLACSDDVVGLMPTITQSGLTPGATYYIRFWRYGGGTGTFSLCINKPATNNSCSQINPICSGSPTIFTANSGGAAANTVNAGNNYGCLASSPNPSWYYFKIGNPGLLNINISAASDVDFAIWGPFSSIAAAQAACNSYGSPISCSYSFSSTEQVLIPGTVTNQVYVLLVTNYANTIQNITMNNAGGSATTNCSIIALPVGYSAWNATASGKQVLLDWTTESEQNNAYFAVQHTADGVTWETIGAVAGNGTSDHSNTYTFTDKAPLPGINYYRLQQVDLDGTPAFSTIVSASVTDEAALTVYPNPAGDAFMIETRAESIESVTLTDPVGKTYELIYTKTTQGIAVNCGNYAGGVYTLRVNSHDNKQASVRLILER